MSQYVNIYYHMFNSVKLVQDMTNFILTCCIPYFILIQLLTFMSHILLPKCKVRTFKRI